MIGLWRQRYRESSRLTKVAFSVVIVSAVLALCTIPLDDQWERVYDLLSVIMFVGLIVLIVDQIRHQSRRRT